MIEEFPFTTRVLQAEKDVNSFLNWIQKEVREAKEHLALLTWARLTWEQRVTLAKLVLVHTTQRKSDKTVYYYTKNHTIVSCETLSQMQFSKDLNFGLVVD